MDLSAELSIFTSFLYSTFSPAVTTGNLGLILFFGFDLGGDFVGVCDLHCLPFGRTYTTGPLDFCELPLGHLFTGPFFVGFDLVTLGLVAPRVLQGVPSFNKRTVAPVPYFDDPLGHLTYLLLGGSLLLAVVLPILITSYK